MNYKFAVVGACLFGFSSVYAGTIDFDLFRTKSSIKKLSVQGQLEKAILEAGNGGTVNLGAKTYTTTDRVLVKRRVNIVGKGRTASTVNNTKSGSIVFQVQSDGVVFRNLQVKKSTYDGTGIRTEGYSNVQIENCNFDNMSFGIWNNFGKKVDGLNVNGCQFRRMKSYAFWLMSRTGYSGEAPKNMGRFLFEKNQIYTSNASKREPTAGVNVDYGNERQSDDKWAVNHKTSKGNSLIKKNTIHGCGEHDIAIARAENILVAGNTCYGGCANSYSQALHIEDRSRNITAQWNHFYNSFSHSGAHAIAIEASNPTDAEYTADLNIQKNYIRCKTGTAILIQDCRNTKVKYNWFQNPRASTWDILTWGNSNHGGCSNMDLAGNYNNARVKQER